MGWSSFAIVGRYCVTQEQRGDWETVVCYERLTGREVWFHSDPNRFHENTSGTGPRATPVVHEGRVYALGATGQLNCLAGSDGEVVWSVNILGETGENALFGMTGSPLIVQSQVIVAPGGVGRSLAAYDTASGKCLWSAGDAATSYASPQLAAFEPTQILNFNAEGLTSHDAKSGTVLWSYPWVSNLLERNNVCQPLPIIDGSAHAPAIFLASGYGRGSVLLQVAGEGTSQRVTPIWKSAQLKPKFSSVVRKGNHIFGLDDKIMVCLDLATGKRRWKAGRYGYGQLILADQTIIVQAESGEVALVAADPTGHREIMRFPALNDRTWNHPVLCDDLLYVRNDREAACYRLIHVE
ncbi:MAG: PQQ-like beta-propeller repeat protein [Planctomycetota bacterium]|nr:PQQ-like beta-propeller repeat protein [Planctomycetota bacterium]MDA1178534.1 PQQ-like beta-propeller repeat protein [Planctomycetota bacterium]